MMTTVPPHPRPRPQAARLFKGLKGPRHPRRLPRALGKRCPRAQPALRPSALAVGDPPRLPPVLRAPCGLWRPGQSAPNVFHICSASVIRIPGQAQPAPRRSGPSARRTRTVPPTPPPWARTGSPAASGGRGGRRPGTPPGPTTWGRRRARGPPRSAGRRRPGRAAAAGSRCCSPCCSWPWASP